MAELITHPANLDDCKGAPSRVRRTDGAGCDTDLRDATFVPRAIEDTDICLQSMSWRLRSRYPTRRRVYGRADLPLALHVLSGF